MLLFAALYALGGMSWLVWGGFVRTFLVLHTTWLVNSATHVWGYRTHETRDTSTNLWWVALLTYGEGWHNNHHAFQTSARHGLRWWELDVTYLAIRLLSVRRAGPRREASEVTGSLRKEGPMHHLLTTGLRPPMLGSVAGLGFALTRLANLLGLSIYTGLYYTVPRILLKCVTRRRSGRQVPWLSLLLRTKRLMVKPMKATPIELCPPCEETHGSAARFELYPLSCSRGENGETQLRDLQDADRRKDEFLAMLGHELRNPLAPIRNAMEIFRLKGAADPEIQEVTEMVERQVQQLARLVDDLLDVSRVGHGKINLQMKPVDLQTVVALAVEISRPLIEARKHVLKVSLPQQAVEVEGDPGRLAQVVSNLLNNSAKYSNDGGRIELAIEAVGDQAVLRVRDTGIGIEPVMLPRIFDLFTQVKGSTSRFAEGLGIGLALVRNMIELHGGCVQAASAGLGHGTEFVVRLPLLRNDARGISAAQDRPWSAMSAPTRRILVVDDNRDAADSMAILLRFAGHEVRTAYDGQTALALARLQPPEVVICDISMPGMCGFELARHLRQDLGLRDSLLVALSGYAQEDRSTPLPRSRLQRPPHQAGASWTA